MAGKIDKNKYLYRLEEYLFSKNVKTTGTGSGKKYQCPHPSHGDEKPSATLYKNPAGDRLNCMSTCQNHWDIFDVCGFLTSAKTFVEQAEEIEKTLSMLPAYVPKPPPKKKPKPKHVILTLEEGRKVYTKKAFLEIAKLAEWGDEIVSTWPYFDKTKEKINIMDVRFIYKNFPEDKKVVSLYWNGKNIKAKNAPVMVYNLHLLSEKKPRLIVEGCKPAEAAAVLTKFTTHAANQGGANITKADWSDFKNEEVYYYPDDDQQINKKTKKLFLPNEQPGIKTALALKEILPHMKIITPMDIGRTVKISGADIFDLLTVVTPEEIETHIFNSPEFGTEKKPANGQPDQPQIPIQNQPDISFFEEDSGEISSDEMKEFPFTPLGVGDDNRAYFLDRNERLFSTLLETLSKPKLLKLASLNFWRYECSYKGKVQWDNAMDMVIQCVGEKDFDESQIKGRGAWRNEKGEICFHDGVKTHGTKDLNSVYLRKASIFKKMGLDNDHASVELCQQMAKTVNKMTFATKLDTIRCLAWSTLAPFAGCLPWRPAILLTGFSGSGKTTILNYVAKMLSGHFIYVNGGDTTVPGLRNRNGNDSTAIYVEEMEGDTEKKMLHRQEFFSLMRQSTSDDAPDTLKGTKDGGYVSYKMQNMFMFVSIDPTIQHEADSKRVFTVNIEKPTGEWAGMKKEIESVMTEKNCRAVRALTWFRLNDILECAEGITDPIRDITGKDNRSSYADALMLATNFIIWRGMKKFSEWNENNFREVTKYISEIFEGHEVEGENENEVHDMLDKLLDHSVNIMEKRETKTLRLMLRGALKGEQNTLYYKETLERYGLKITRDKKLAIVKKNNTEIINIIGRGKDYAQFLIRHESLIDKSRVVQVAGKPRRCLIFDGMLEFADDEENDDLPPEETENQIEMELQ